MNEDFRPIIQVTNRSVELSHKILDHPDLFVQIQILLKYILRGNSYKTKVRPTICYDIELELNKVNVA